MAANDEDDGNVNAGGNQAEPSEIDQYLEEISSNRRLSQDHEVESNQDETKETTDTSASCSQGVDRSIFQNTSSDKEMSNEQGTSSNQLLADSSTTSNVPVTSVVASSSGVTNDETRDQQKEPFSKDNDDSIELSKLGFSSSSDDREAEQSITTTASSPGRSPSVPITNTLIPRTDFVPRTLGTPQAMNPRYPQWQVSPGQYSNITRPPYSPFQQHGGSSNMRRPYGHMVPSPYFRPEQNYMGPPYFPPPSAPPFQQRGGSNMIPPYFPPFQQRGGSNIYNYNMVPPSDVYMGPYPYGYPNNFDTSAHSRFGYEGVPGDYLSSIRQHQSGDSAVYPQGQQQQQLPWRYDFATQNQQDDRRDDPSDQTQRDN